MSKQIRSITVQCMIFQDCFLKFSRRSYLTGKGMPISNNLHLCFCSCLIVFTMFIMVWTFTLFILYLKYFTFAREPISKISSSTIAFVWSLGVNAASINIAVVLPQSTLVNIWKTDTLILGTTEYNAKSLYNSELSVNWSIDKGSKAGKRSRWELMFLLGSS